MLTLVLNADISNLSIEHLLKKADNGGVELCSSDGRVVAFVLSPTDREGWTCAEAKLDLIQHSEEVNQALARRGGVTTAELLRNAASATPVDNSQ